MPANVLNKLLQKEALNIWKQMPIVEKEKYEIQAVSLLIVNPVQQQMNIQNSSLKSDA